MSRRGTQGLTLEPCLARTSHSPLVNVTSSLIAHLKSPIKSDDSSYRRTFMGQRSATAAAAAALPSVWWYSSAQQWQPGCNRDVILYKWLKPVFDSFTQMKVNSSSVV